MYFLVLLVCLQSAPQCFPLVEDPVVHYTTIEECEVNLQATAKRVVEYLIEEDQVGTIQGRCIKDPDANPA